MTFHYYKHILLFSIHNSVFKMYFFSPIHAFQQIMVRQYLIMRLAIFLADIVQLTKLRK